MKNENILRKHATFQLEVVNTEHCWAIAKPAVTVIFRQLGVGSLLFEECISL